MSLKRSQLQNGEEMSCPIESHLHDKTNRSVAEACTSLELAIRKHTSQPQDKGKASPGKEIN